MSEPPGQFRWDPPHYAWIKFENRISEEQAGRLLQQVLDHSAELPFVLMTVDIEDMAGASPESRRVSAQIMKKMPRRAIAVIGGSFSQRVVSKLVLTATEILGGGRQVSAFFKDPSLVRAWLDAQARAFEDKSS